MTATDLGAFLRAGPHEPIVTRAQVLEIPCRLCGVDAGAECVTSGMRPTFGGIALRGMAGVHLRRYQDVAHDPR
jgi:hypothetical protein